MLQAIGVMARSQLRETRESIGDALDNAESRRARPNRGKKRRQYCGCRFVAPVAEKAGEADAEDGAIQPGLFFWRVSHGIAVYRRERSIQIKNEFRLEPKM
jgi:hypothetical protein